MSKATITGSGLYSWEEAGTLPLMIQDGSTSYVYGEGGRALKQIDASGNVRSFHQDQLGSTRMLTDGAGKVAATYSYDAYGNLTSETGTVANPLRFAGEYADTETGLYYLRARYYDLPRGQFISRDPLAALTRSPYGYVGGNPLNHTDPLGLFDPSSTYCAVYAGQQCSGDPLAEVRDTCSTDSYSCGLEISNLEESASLQRDFIEMDRHRVSPCLLGQEASQLKSLSMALAAARYLVKQTHDSSFDWGPAISASINCAIGGAGAAIITVATGGAAAGLFEPVAVGCAAGAAGTYTDTIAGG